MKNLLFILFIFAHQFIYAQIITSISTTGISDPNGLAFDSHGNLYVGSPLGDKIWKIDTSGVISNFAGTGGGGFSGDGGPATAAQFNQVGGIAIDSLDNILFADIENNRIRKVTIATGIITTIIGNDTAGYYGDGGPASAASLNVPGTICFDNSGNLYVADAGNNRVRKVNTLGIISTFVGNGILGASGDGGPATAAECYPTGICTDNLGNLYISNYGVVGSSCTVRVVNSSGIITNIAGDSAYCSYNGDGIPATAAQLGVTYITIYNGLLYLSDACNNRVREIDSNGIIHTVAGNGIVGYSGDGGPADSAKMHDISGIAFDHCGNLYIAQDDVAHIRKVTFDSTCDPFTTKVQNIQPDVKITIYPNPASEVLHIDGVKTATEYRLLNITGIIEQTGTLKEGSNSIYLRGLARGMYLLEMTDVRGYRVVRKVVKE